MLYIKKNAIPAYKAAIIMIIVFTTIIASAQGQVGLEPLRIEPTRVYGAYEAFLPGGVEISHARYDPARDMIIAVGKGFLALIKPGEPPTLVWSEAIIGEPTVLELDRISNPGWIVIGTSTGEVTALNLGDLGERMSYYTSEGVSIKSAYIAEHDSDKYIMALNENGYLYLYKASEPYWGVIGPDPGEGPLTYMSKYEIAWFTPLFVKPSWDRGYWDPTRVIVALNKYPEDILSTLEAYLYYKERGTGVEKPIIPGESQVENTTIKEVRKLLYVLTAHPYGSTYRYEEITTNATSNFISIGGLPPVILDFNVFYTITRIDTSLNATVSSECYYGSRTVNLKPGESTFIQKLVATYLASNIEACLSKTGISLEESEKIGFGNFLAVDSTPIPYKLQLNDNVKLVVIPVKGDVQLSSSKVFSLVKPKSTPNNWPKEGYALLAIGVGKELYIYILDDELDILNIPGTGGPFERISLEAEVTSIEISPDASRLYVGTSSGRLMLLEWFGSEGRYVEKHSIQVSGTPVISIIELVGGQYVAAASQDGSLQLVSLSDWKPQWRGVPAFSSINLRVGLSSMFHIDGVNLFAITQQGGLLIFNHGLEPYVPLLGSVKVLVKKIDGSLSPFNTDYYLEALSDLSIMAREKIVENKAVLYVPEKQITLGVYIEGLGRAVFPPMTAKYPIATFTSTLLLREAQIYIYTPDKGKSSFEDPGYKLVAGPRSGANVTLIPTGQETTLEYSIVGEPVNATASMDGIASIILWDGLEYSGVAELKGFKQSSFTIQALDPVSISVEMHPILYSITLEALDKEAFENKIIFRVPEATFTINNVDYGTIVSVGAEKGTINIGLPEGTYTITASSLYYHNSTIEGLMIKGSKNVKFTLKPKYYNVSLNVELVDELYGLASGPLPRALVKVTLTNPALGYTIETRSHTSLILRYGEYKVEVRDPLLGDKILNIIINADGDYPIKIPPLYSNVKLELYDSELENVYVPNAVLRANYITDYWVNTATINLDRIPLELKLPYGNYTFIIISFGYKDLQVNKTINEPTIAVKERMEPRKVKVTINTVFRDELTGIARGGVPSAQIEARLITPNVTKTPIQLVTGPNGSITAVMRVGIYTVTTDSAYTESEISYLRIDKPGIYTIELKPIYSNITIEVVDDEIPVTIPGVTIHVKRLGPGLPTTLTVTSDDGVESLILPIGSYSFSATLPSRYTSDQYTIDLSSKDRYTRLTIEAVPVRVSVDILAQALNAYVKYRDSVDLLPPGPISNATITLVPADPLLERVGVGPVTTNSGFNGIARFEGIRTGTYLILVQAEGYIASITSASILTEGQRISVGLTPLVHKVSLIIMDPELVPELSVLDKVNVTVIAYNNVTSSITIPYNVGDTLEMATGTYTVLLSSNGYTDTPATFTVLEDASYNLTIMPLKYNVTVELQGITEFGTLPVDSGIIIAEAVGLNLINPIISSSLEEGVAILKLRAGTYSIMYIEPSIGYQEKLGLLNITEDTTITKSIEAPTVTIEFIILDSEFEVPVNVSSISIEYLGPFGKGSKKVETKGSVAVTTLPAGIIRVAASAPGYLDLRERFNVSSDSSLELRLTPFKVDALFTILNPDEEQLTGVSIKAIFKHKTLPYTAEGVADKGVLVLKDIRIGSYTVELIPPLELPYSNTTLNVRILSDGTVEPDVLIVDYKVFNISIRLLDRDTGEPLKVPYKVTLARMGKGSERLGFPLTIEVAGEASVSLPPGTYRVEIAPIDKEYYLTPATAITFKVPDSSSVSITLTAKQFPVSILIVDDRGDPVPAAFVRIIGEGGVVIDAGYTDVTGAFTSQLKFGTYSVEVEKPGYSMSTIPFQVPQSTTVTVELKPGPMILVRRFLPLIIGVGGLVTLAGTLYIMRERISRRILEEEEYF